jgi:hypothetical protein
LINGRAPDASLAPEYCVSSTANIGLRRHAVSWLYDRMLVKPTDLDVFVSTIRALLARAH